MLTIRNAQMEALQQAVTRDFLHRLCVYLLPRGRHGGDQAGAVLGREAVAGLTLARNLRFTAESDVVRLLENFWITYGTLTPTLPSTALAILGEWGVPPRGRIEQFRQWQAQSSRTGASGGGTRRCV